MSHDKDDLDVILSDRVSQAISNAMAPVHERLTSLEEIVVKPPQIFVPEDPPPAPSPVIVTPVDDVDDDDVPAEHHAGEDDEPLDLPGTEIFRFDGVTKQEAENHNAKRAGFMVRRTPLHRYVLESIPFQCQKDAPLVSPDGSTLVFHRKPDSVDPRGHIEILQRSKEMFAGTYMKIGKTYHWRATVSSPTLEAFRGHKKLVTWLQAYGPFPGYPTGKIVPPFALQFLHGRLRVQLYGTNRIGTGKPQWTNTSKMFDMTSDKFFSKPRRAYWRYVPSPTKGALRLEIDGDVIMDVKNVPTCLRPLAKRMTEIMKSDFTGPADPKAQFVGPQFRFGVYCGSQIECVMQYQDVDFTVE